MARNGIWSGVHSSVWPGVSCWGSLGPGGGCVLLNCLVSAKNLISAFNSLSLVGKHGMSISLPPVLYRRFSLALWCAGQ